MDPTEREPAPPKDAATIVVMRPEARGFSVFLVQRHGRSGFMANAHVFPGGKLDPSDCEPAIAAHVVGVDAAGARARLGEPDLSAERALGLHVAGVRETFEEAGVLLADVPEAGGVAAARSRLHSGEAFARVVESLGAKLRLDRLVPWTRWITPAVEPRRYDTRFFLAVVPQGQEAEHDHRETTAAEWLTPTAALERQAAGDLLLAPPTHRSLEMLAAYDDPERALTAAATRPPPLVEPIFKDLAGTLALVLPGDPEHPIPTPAIPGATRFLLENGRFWSRNPAR